MYAGRRRRGDFQWYLEDLAKKFDFPVWIVSLDIIIDMHHGDVSKDSVRQFWCQAIIDRWVCSVLCGPPCETWSVARGQKIVDSQGNERAGPRPVRGHDCPWGMSSLRLRELHQVLTGNVLMSFGLEAVVLVGIHGGPGVLEHPQEPDDPQKPSIWRQSIMSAISMLPGFKTLQLSQGFLGARSVKPTQLLVANLPELADQLRQWQLTEQAPGFASIGMEDGHFKTAGLKEYPPALCAALASTVARRLPHLHTAQSVRPTPAFLSICKDMISSKFGDFIGADYAGGR